MNSDPTPAEIAKGLTAAQRGFLTTPLFRSPRNHLLSGLPAAASYSPARKLPGELAERENGQNGTTWYYLTLLGKQVRNIIMEQGQ